MIIAAVPIAALAACAPELEQPSTSTSIGPIITFNGMSLNGMSLNGMSLHGMSLHGMSLHGTGSDGSVIEGLNLIGAHLVALLDNDVTLEVRIDDIAPLTGANADLLAYACGLREPRGGATREIGSRSRVVTHSSQSASSSATSRGTD
jgi:hypothetical protein